MPAPDVNDPFPLCSLVDIRGLSLYTNDMGTIIAVIAIVAFFALVFVFILGAGRVSARAEQRAYVNTILHNIEVRGALDAEFRN